MKIIHLDPEKFKKARRNIIITYFVFAIVGLGVVYLNIGEALFGQAWMLIPFVAFVFSLAGWFAFRQRKKFWEDYQITLQEDAILIATPKMPEIKFKASEITGVKEIRQGLIISVQLKENAMLVPKDLRDEDLKEVKRILTNWADAKH